MAASLERNLYISHPKDRQKTYRLWERLHTDGFPEDTRMDPYERMLCRDWVRCQKLGVDPAMRQGVVLAPSEFEKVLQDKTFLLAKAKPSLDKVSELLRGVPGIVIFTDDRGTILYIVGDPDVRATAAEVSRITEGSRWLESLAGTNGIGTAIERKEPVHVYATEHFCEGWHRWTCAASPIIEPFTNQVMGVVDFTTLDKDYREDAVALTHSLARSISAELRLQLELERMQLVHAYSLYASRYPTDGVIVFDRLNCVVRSSKAAAPIQDGLGSERAKLYLSSGREVCEVCVSSADDPIGKLMVVSGRRLPHQRSTKSSAEASEAAVFGEFVTRSEAVIRMMERIEKVVPSDLNVLLIGETGTGKELIGSYIHEQSSRKSGPFVAINCSAISKELFESRFFGYERGAFTGADPRGKKGLFEAADGGTLFLDEIGEMPIDIQAGLLRVLEKGRFRRVGSSQEMATNCRIIAATNRPLLENIKQGSFRSDLYYRLSVATFVIPPLRERPEDIPVLIEHILRRFCEKNSLPQCTITTAALDVLTRYSWPGNVRELRNILESTMICSDGLIDIEDLPVEITRRKHPAELSVFGSRDEEEGHSASDHDLCMRDHKKRLIVCALAKYGNVSRAAKALGVPRSTLYRMFKSFDISHTDYTAGRMGA